jgi:hypothetical protein
VNWPVLLQHGIAQIGAGDLLDPRLDAELGERALQQHRGGLRLRGIAEIDRNRRLEAAAIADLGQQRLGFFHVSLVGKG